KLYNAQKDALQQGRVPRIRVVNGEVKRTDQGMTVKELVNDFLLAKYNRVARGKLAPRTFTALKDTCQRLPDEVGRDRPVDGLLPRDFTKLQNTLPATWGPVRVGNEVGRVKSVFAYAYKNGYLKTPMQYGSEFERPDKEEIRKARKGEKLFT